MKKNRELVLLRVKPSKIYLSDFRTVYAPRTELAPTARDLKSSASYEKKPPLALTLFRATRPFAFTASFVSTALGTLLAPQINPLLFLLAAAGVILIHAGVDALNDLMDYRYGYDDWLVVGASRVLQDKKLSTRAQAMLVIVLLAAGAGIGALLAFLAGIEILIIGLVGLCIGVLYQVKPFGFKYRALGDLSVFLAFGPLLSLGAYFVQTRTLSWLPVAAVVPAGLLVVGIVHANNFRDLVEDASGGYKTVAALLGQKGSSVYYAALVILAYLLPIPLVILGILPPLSFLYWLSLPWAYLNLRLSFRPDYLVFGMLDLLTARLHLIYGVLLLGGMLVSRLFPGLW